MSKAPDDPPRDPLTITAADLLAHRYSPAEHRAGCEAAYRRGVHQALALAHDLVEDSQHRKEALRRIGRAGRLAGELRRTRKAEGNGMLIDWLRTKLARRPAAIGRTRP